VERESVAPAGVDAPAKLQHWSFTPRAGGTARGWWSRPAAVTQRSSQSFGLCYGFARQSAAAATAVSSPSTINSTNSAAEGQCQAKLVDVLLLSVLGWLLGTRQELLFSTLQD